MTILVEPTAPKLFGIENSNRDFGKKESWGKNQFNSAFPASLACYMFQQNIEPVYLVLDSNLRVVHNKINVKDIFGINPLSKNLFFSFERDYVPYQSLMIGRPESVDLVTFDLSGNICLRGIEVKLTALPDNVTCNSTQDKYGCEIVVRPPTIVYLAMSIATTSNPMEIIKHLGPTCDKITDWTEMSEVLPRILEMIVGIDNILKAHIGEDKPLVMQPIWKTLGKSPELTDNCLDMFIWSDLAFTRLFIDATKEGKSEISRNMRTIVWLTKMLYDIATTGHMDYRGIIDKITFNTKNDKAFAVNGLITNRYMRSAELLEPRVLKSSIRDMILNGGEEFLSPERRFDAVIKNTPGLF